MSEENESTSQLSQEPNSDFQEQIDRLEQERREWEEQKRKMEAEISEMSGELHEQEHLLSLKSLEMQQRREEFLILRRRLEEDHISLKSQKTELTKQGAEPSSSGDVNSEPSTYEEMKAKMLREEALEGNSPGGEQSDDADSSSMHETETQEENDEVDVDIDEYMRNLLSRNPGSASSQPVTPSVAKAEQRSTQSTQTAPEASIDQSQQSDGKHDKGSDLSKKTPLYLNRRKGDHRREPIVDQSNLSAMRDLANQSSQDAIAKYASKRLVVSAAGKGAVCFTGLLSGSLLLFWGNTLLILLGALAAFSVASFWAAQVYTQLKRTGMVSTWRNVKSVRPAGLPPEQGRTDGPEENE